MIRDEKKVSIIMPCYNCEKYLLDSVKSVFNQQYSHWELIIVDDLSEDGSWELINDLARKYSNISGYKNEKQLGAAESRNIAIRNSSGRFIAFLDSDDVWKKRKLHIQINYMINNNFPFTCTSYDKINELSENINKCIKTKKIYKYKDLIKDCPGNSTVVYDSKKIGIFEIENIKKRNDYLLWLQIIKKTKVLVGIESVLSSHRVHEESLSHNKKSLLKYHWLIYRKYEKMSLLLSLYYTIYWILKAVLKSRK